MSDFNRTESIKRLTGDAYDRVTFDPDLGRHDPHLIKCGVVFVHAFWAGSSTRCLSDFCKALIRTDKHSQVLFVVCDIDDISPRASVLYNGGITGGNGDIFWIADGNVRARHTASRSCDFDTTTQSLLNCCHSSTHTEPDCSPELG